MIIGVTGHRPDKILIDKFNGYNPYVSYRLFLLARNALRSHKPEVVVTGMALGWDLAIADAARKEGIPYIAALAFKGQESNWSDEDKRKYKILLDFADEVHVSSETPSKSAYLDRDRWVVDSSDYMIALWNKEKTGGTAYTVRYANEREKDIVNLWGTWEKYKATPFNFSLLQRVSIVHKGITYPSLETFYHAMKTEDLELRLQISKLDGIEAKKFVKTIEIRPDWPEVKDKVLRWGLTEKYSKYPYNKILLESTDEIIFWNFWHDTDLGKCYCNHCKGHGSNKLGIMLEELREEMRDG